MNGTETIWFVYDGECPICTLGADFYKVRKSVGRVQTVDARTEKDHPVMREVNDAKLNLDEGMVVKYQGRLYQGRDALHLMAQLGATDDMLNAINNTIFKSKALAHWLYPSMKAARNLALKLKGVGRIDNLKG
jgi:predicted DCC family thiol-disulfide oxidoreductase YuxK